MAGWTLIAASDISDDGLSIVGYGTNPDGNTEAWIATIPQNMGTTTRYVWQESPSPAPPYTNWATAATNIQDAVDAADPGDTVLVTNGVYATGGRAVYGTMTNRVAVDKPLSLLSMNGPEVTIIQGHQVSGTTNGDGAIRCVYLTSGASLSGFTFRMGATRTDGDIEREQSGGGVWCEEYTDTMVSDSLFISNSASRYGGGVYFGTLSNCTLIGNSAGWGGGAYESKLNYCKLTGNSAGSQGGGAFGANNGELNYCTLTGNSAVNSGGGAYDGWLINCVLTGNSADVESGNGGGAAFSYLQNCTVISNSAYWEGGVTECILDNCIIYFNNGNIRANYDPGSTLRHCCTWPLPTNGLGNITNAPLFVDADGWSNLRLQSNSPCINAGTNVAWINSTDLDGRPRIVVGTVDMGAYEFQGPGFSEFIGWLQQHALPTDGSADFTDADTDGHNNWQEWKTWTVPTNPLSVLKLLSPQPEANGTLISWQSVLGHSYLLERATNANGSFSLLQGNIPGQTGTTGFTDTNAAAGNGIFYRVAVPE